MTTSSLDYSQEAVPLVIVEGFLCSTRPSVWGRFADYLDHGSEMQARADINAGYKGKRRIILVPVGPFSSIHDRACELFHGLRGTRVDYGHAHSSRHGHSRYGRKAGKALLPEWGSLLKEGDVSRSSLMGTAHFIGHSLGGLTIAKMYQLLSNGFFNSYLGLEEDDKAASGLVLSLTGISSPFRGTPLVYLLGLQPTSLPLVRFLSPGDCLAKLVHVFLWARRLPLVQNRFFKLDEWMPDFFADAWQFAGRASKEECQRRRFGEDGGEHPVDCCCRGEARADCQDVDSDGDSPTWRISELLGLSNLFSQLKLSSWAEGKDCAPWDCSFTQREAEEHTEDSIWSSPRPSSSSASSSRPKVWLRSYAAYIDLDNHDSRGITSLFLSWIALRISKYDYSASLPPGSRRSATLVDQEMQHHNDSGYTSASDETSASPLRKPRERKVPATVYRDWYCNDGVVPLASQYHPGNCKEGHCVHDTMQAGTDSFPQTASSSVASSIRWLLSSFVSDDTLHDARRIDEAGTQSTVNPIPPSSNIWHVTTIKDTTHASLAPFFTGSSVQVRFWQDVGCWLQLVEATACK
jgi:hypothetical protein